LNGNGADFTVDEIKLIKEQYPLLGISIAPQLPRHSREAIQWKAKYLVNHKRSYQISIRGIGNTYLLLYAVAPYLKAKKEQAFIIFLLNIFL
jgi:hypothetical protein